MEYEVRFYFATEELNKLLEKLSCNSELKMGLRTYEKTVQYNHCDPKYDFYSKEIDGRFRFRISSNEKHTNCKLSWKRRLKDSVESSVNKEEEKEFVINENDVENFLYIVTNVLHFSVVESYERYRTIFSNEDIEISIDEYPFGIALEIENKSVEKNPEEVVTYWVNRLGLDLADAYRLSWDDKYLELCQAQNIQAYKEVTFDKEMPSIKL